MYENGSKIALNSTCIEGFKWKKLNLVCACVILKQTWKSLNRENGFRTTFERLNCHKDLAKQYDYLFKLTIEFIHYLQKLYKYIGYLHSYCHNEQQNKDNLITYQKKLRYQFLHYGYIYYTITYATYDEQKNKRMYVFHFSLFPL